MTRKLDITIESIKIDVPSKPFDDTKLVEISPGIKVPYGNIVFEKYEETEEVKKLFND